MTAVEIVAAVEKAGGRVEVAGPDRIRIHAPSGVLSDALKTAVVEHKSELIVLLRMNELESQRLLRDCRWPLTLPVCPFLVGRPGSTCNRCGASWLEHYPKSD
jgi:hypothetical protein